MKELAYLNKYLYKYRLQLILGVLFVSLSNVFKIIPAQLVRHSINLVTDKIGIYSLVKDTPAESFFQDDFYATILFYGVIILISALISGVFLFLTRQTIIVVSRYIEYDLKNEVYAHYQSLPLSFYRKNNTGDLMNRISEDVSKVRMYLGPAIMYGINLIVTFVIVVSYMVSINAELTLYALLPLPILSVSIYFVNNTINKRSEKIQESLSDMSTFVQEAFSGIRVIKSFVQEKQSNSDFLDQSNEFKDRSLRLTKVDALFFPLITGLIGLSIILTVFVGGRLVIAGHVTPGNIAEFIIYVNMLTWPVAALGWVTSIIQRAAASQKRLNEFLNTKNDILSTENLKKEVEGKIRFENVSFVYPDSGVEALKDISFDVAKGETLAILGTTGSGKSTIANLIFRMYDVSEGQIDIDGVDIKKFNTQQLRSQMGYVPQDVFLFSDSIRQNIAFGADSVEESDVIQAAKDADLYENILGFDKGFDTVLGERGVTLSGGQKQRVSIARAIIRKPSILILDDSLSAVDTKTENAILNSLKSIMKDRTSIIISHRISSAKLANKIVVLNQGEIVESGTHETLLANNGMYKDLYEKQLQSEEEIEL